MDVDNDGAGIGQFIQQLAIQMSNVSSALNAQGIAQIVQVMFSHLKAYMTK